MNPVPVALQPYVFKSVDGTVDCIQNVRRAILEGLRTPMTARELTDYVNARAKRHYEPQTITAEVRWLRRHGHDIPHVRPHKRFDGVVRYYYGLSSAWQTDAPQRARAA